MDKKNTATLLIYCPDQTGIVAAVSGMLSKHSANIVYLDQYVDNELETFFMRVEWELKEVKQELEYFQKDFKEGIAKQYNMTWKLFTSNKKQKMAVFVSKMSHCLYEILAKEKSGEWNVEIPFIISNHEDLKHIADAFSKRFVYLPITKENKLEQEAIQKQLLDNASVDFVVLARYMQILSPTFIDNYKDNIINIHHSFLPAFVGAKPYHNAYERGVKIIGATSHYVTNELDAGPIIEQDIVRITHKDSVKEMIRRGRDLEKIVLSRAIYNHLTRKILVFGNKTIIFD